MGPSTVQSTVFNQEVPLLPSEFVLLCSFFRKTLLTAYIGLFSNYAR